MASFKAELADVPAASDAIKVRLTAGTREYSNAISSINNTLAQVRQNQEKWTAARSGSSASDYQNYVNQAAALESLSERLQNSELSASQFNTEFAKIKANMASSASNIKAAGEATKSLKDRMSGLASKFTSWLGVSQVIMYAIRGMKQMVTASIELQDAFAQLEIVTGASEAQMAEFKDTSVNLAQELGKSVSDVTKSIETFSRLGYALNDASSLAKYATVLANVAAVGTDEATTGLTSIIKGFNMGVSEASHVADVLVEVGQKYAVSAGEMMEAYERSGAALSATNTSFEKSAGLIAAANAAVQDSSVVGTALKTISARIRGSKSDLESLGESTEDLVDGFSKYAEEIKALTGFDIIVDDTTNTFKDLYDIMEGIAGVWDKLTDTQQARVAEILGGTRQLQVISSILGNWGDAVGAYETAMNSAGAATRANDIYMDTATAHINQFKAAFQAFSSDMVSGGLISGIVDIGTGLLNIADSVAKVINAFGSLPAVISTAMLAMSFKNVGELINQFQLLIILWVEYAHEAFTNGNMNETMCTLAA